MDFSHFYPWYIRVLGTIYYVLESFLFTGSGVFWRKVVILLHFGDKMEKNL